MCGKVKIHKLLASPGDTLNVKIKSNQTISLCWGISMSDRLLYNTRYESLVRKSFWRSMLLNHCILETNGFFESTKLFIPASLNKLITTFSALETFGSEYRYPTKIFSDSKPTPIFGGNIYIKGFGNPVLNPRLTEIPCLRLADEGVCQQTKNCQRGK